MRTLLCLGLLTALLPIQMGHSQPSDYALSLPQVQGVQGGVVTCDAFLDNFGVPLSGWSFGVCHDPSVAVPVASALGSDVLAVTGGAVPNFHTTLLFADGVAHGVLLGAFLPTLPPGTGLQLLEVEYELLGAPGSSTALTYCDTVGSPPFVTNLTTATGTDFVPDQFSGSLEVDLTGPGFSYHASHATATFDPASGVGHAQVELSIAEDSAGPGFPNSTLGFSMALAHDASLMTVDHVEAAATLAALNNGMGPDFFAAQSTLGGVTVGVVYSLSPAATTQEFAQQLEVVQVDYVTRASQFAGQSQSIVTPVSWPISLGNPPIENLVVTSISGTTLNVAKFLGSVTWSPTSGRFLRGDCNQDVSVNLSDAIALLAGLFTSAGPWACPRACDTNDDGSINVTDAVFLLENLFANGAALPLPSACGFDPTPDSLTCPSPVCP